MSKRLQNPGKAYSHISHLKKRKFLIAYAKLGTGVAAEEASGVSRRSHYEWIQSDPAYKAAFEAAEEESVQRLESELRRRALDGVRKADIRMIGTIEQKGKDENGQPIVRKVNKYEQVGTITEYSDTCLIFLLKSKRPEVYRERFEHVGKDGGPIQYSDVRDTLRSRITQLAARIGERAADSGIVQ